MATEADGTPTPLPEDRPAQNVMGEVNRKFGQLTQKVDALTNYLAEKEAAQAKPQPQRSTSLQNMSKDELWELAKAGNKEAFDAHEARTADEVYTRRRSQEQHEGLVGGQLQILQGKYPVLGDPNHPLTQTRDAAYSLLTRRGYPAGDATFLEATKTAIADRPDIIAEMHTQGTRAREGARRVSAGNSGVTGATVRQNDPQTQGQVRVTPEQMRIAQRMNVSDPAKAITNFLKRQETGQSQFGAVVNSIPNGEF